MRTVVFSVRAPVELVEKYKSLPPEEKERIRQRVLEVVNGAPILGREEAEMIRQLYILVESYYPNSTPTPVKQLVEALYKRLKPVVG